MKELLEKCKSNATVVDAFVKANSVINNPKYKNIVCSVSGGADSDVMLDLLYKVDKDKKITYVFFNTGLEYKATKEHLKYLENRYAITIKREKAIKPIPLAVKEYGQPFLSKYVSEHLHRLQLYNFKWENESLDVLKNKYPNLTGALKWWTNNNKQSFMGKNKEENEGASAFDINRFAYLKEFIMANPPRFLISAECCEWAKKKPSFYFAKKMNADLIITGVRKAEGGIRRYAYDTCVSLYETGPDKYRPLFWFLQEDKEFYEKLFNIKHSDCYCKWGFPRTGCVCCPYGKALSYELNKTKYYEPNMYKAVNTVFKESYEYTKQYRQFVKDMKRKEKRHQVLF